MKRECWMALLGAGLCAFAALGACGGAAAERNLGNDSESHFLAHCTPGSCDAGLSCIFGVCTIPCASNDECAALSPNASCVGAAAELDSTRRACDVACIGDAACQALEPDWRCVAGMCRVDRVAKARPIFGGCASADHCSDGLSCVYGRCTRGCEVDADCGFDGASCTPAGFVGSIPGDALPTTQPYCTLPCVWTGNPSAASPLWGELHAQCAALGPGGRCGPDGCYEAFTGQCGDVGQPNAAWQCYQDIAAGVFQSRHAALLDDEVCLPASEGRYYMIEYRRCADTTCADGRLGCPAAGLSLETVPTTVDEQSTSELTPVLAALGEARLREPIRVNLELLNPVERCEYSLRVSFSEIPLLDGYVYLSPSGAGFSAAAGSPQAIEAGLFQPVHHASFGNSGRGPVVENAVAELELLSGGERCASIQELVAAGVRSDLSQEVGNVLRDWAQGVSDTLECTPCGALDCELACRFR